MSKSCKVLAKYGQYVQIHAKVYKDMFKLGNVLVSYGQVIQIYANRWPKLWPDKAKLCKAM